MSKVWFITGAGRGMGVDIAKAALAAGNNVVAGSGAIQEMHGSGAFKKDIDGIAMPTPRRLRL